MAGSNSGRGSFPLRLPVSMRRQADEFARRDGLSLNQFITLAVAEKLTRMEGAKETTLYQKLGDAPRAGTTPGGTRSNVHER
jgi:hypothetical protein